MGSLALGYSNIHLDSSFYPKLSQWPDAHAWSPTEWMLRTASHGAPVPSAQLAPAPERLTSPLFGFVFFFSSLSPFGLAACLWLTHFLIMGTSYCFSKVVLLALCRTILY